MQLVYNNSSGSLCFLVALLTAFVGIHFDTMDILPSLLWGLLFIIIYCYLHVCLHEYSLELACNIMWLTKFKLIADNKYHQSHVLMKIVQEPSS